MSQIRLVRIIKNLKIMRLLIFLLYSITDLEMLYNPHYENIITSLRVNPLVEKIFDRLV